MMFVVDGNVWDDVFVDDSVGRDVQNLNHS